jgi:hypothetical protein
MHEMEMIHILDGSKISEDNIIQYRMIISGENNDNKIRFIVSSCTVL